MKLDAYEQELLISVESGEWQSKNNLQARTKELQSYIKNEKKKAISLRVSENDIYELKKKPLKTLSLIKISSRCLSTNLQLIR